MSVLVHPGVRADRFTGKRIKTSLVTLLLFLAPLLTFAFSTDTVFVGDFGLQPNTKENAVQAVQLALTACKTREYAVLVFAKGRYDFWPQHSVEKEYFESNTTAINPKRCPIWINDFKNLTIDARGSDFIFHDRVQPFTFEHCATITLKNVSIDWDIPLTAQGMVTDTGADYVDLKIDTVANPFIIEAGKLVFTGEGWESPWWGTMEFERSSHLIVPRTGDAGVLGDDWEQYTATRQPGGNVRLHYPFARKPATGNILVLRHSERDHAGIFITDSKNIHLEKINLYQTAGLGILSQYSENLFFRYVQVIPNSAKGRYYSGHDDGCHFSNCKGAIIVDHCVFSGLMDDPINVHGTAVQILEKKSARELLCRFMHEQSTGMEWARTGDSVGFINHETMQTTTTGIVEDFKPLNHQDFIITFRAAVPASIRIKDALENLTWTPALTIRHSLFSVNRARGILVSTPRAVVIEDNIFESSGSAILIAGDANQWFESGAVRDVLIRRNNFRDVCLTSPYQFCEAIISIDPEIPRPDDKRPFHRNIVITENQFHPFDYPVLYAKSVDGLRFTNNTITRSHRFEPFHPRKYMFTFQGCKKVVIAGNRLEGAVLGKNILLEKMTMNELIVHPAAVFSIKKDQRR